jgi:hypothetical protein
VVIDLGSDAGDPGSNLINVMLKCTCQCVHCAGIMVYFIINI